MIAEEAPRDIDVSWGPLDAGGWGIAAQCEYSRTSIVYWTPPTSEPEELEKVVVAQHLEKCPACRGYLDGAEPILERVE